MRTRHYLLRVILGVKNQQQFNIQPKVCGSWSTYMRYSLRLYYLHTKVTYKEKTCKCCVQTFESGCFWNLMCTSLSSFFSSLLCLFYFRENWYLVNDTCVKRIISLFPLIALMHATAKHTCTSRFQTMIYDSRSRIKALYIIPKYLILYSRYHSLADFIKRHRYFWSYFLINDDIRSNNILVSSVDFMLYLIFRTSFLRKRFVLQILITI